MPDPDISSEPAVKLDPLLGNVRKFYLYRLFSGLGAYVWLPIALLYFVDRGLTVTEIMLLWSLFSIAILASEVPTGVIADRLSRKWSVVAGRTLSAAALVVFLSTASFSFIIVGYLAYGLGHALSSGADSALLYDSLKLSGRENSFRRVIGTALTWQLSGQVAGPLITGIVVGVGDMSWALIAGFLFYLSSALAASFLADPPTVPAIRAAEPVIGSSFAGHLRHLKTSLRVVTGSRELLAIVVIGLVIFDFTELMKRPFVQPYLVFFGFSASQIGYLYSLFVAVAAVVARVSHRLDEAFRGDERKLIAITAVVGVAGLVSLVNATATWLAVAAVFVMFSLDWGLREPLIQTSLNRRVPSEYRAACLSVVNMIFSFVTVFTGPFFGFLVDAYSLKTGLTVFQFAFGPLLLIAAVIGWSVLRPVPGSVSDMNLR